MYRKHLFSRKSVVDYLRTCTAVFGASKVTMYIVRYIFGPVKYQMQVLLLCFNRHAFIEGP